MPKALFQKKILKIQTLGDYLCSIRKQLNLDIKTVSKLTQIKPEYIQGLEDEDWAELPNEVYIRGFLKRLAEIYGSSERALIEQYEKQQGFGSKTAPKSKKTLFNFSLTPKVLILGSSAAVGLFAIGYVILQINSVLSTPFLALSEPESDTKVLGKSIIVSGRAEVGAEVMINNQTVLVDKNGQFTENLILSAGLNVVEITARNKFNRESKVVRQINAEIPQEQADSTNLPVNITVEIGPESTWIYMEADSVVVQRGTMLAGSSRTVSASSEIILTSANAGSTKVIYNNNDLGKLGRPGEVIRNVEFSSRLANPSR
jgi:hypothetical protein